ncbi:hypothetical protein SBA7_300018 [Candidatus Sulfotelmatobacter sp. SbA7]|nr:hypothetical protein SBA7_300018 [Candidatus Sulfotelmatobacter sp. SbA7]
MGVAPLRSTSIFPIFSLPWKSFASSSTIGARARQGPHHVAQKSTRTGVSDLSTSWSKFESVTSMMPFAAIYTLPWRALGSFIGVKPYRDQRSRELIILAFLLDARQVQRTQIAIFSAGLTKAGSRTSDQESTTTGCFQMH